MTSKKPHKNSAQSLAQLMSDPEGGFGRILERARALDQLGCRVAGLMDVNLAKHCKLANVRDGKMIFVCSSPGHATRLKLQSSQLLEEVRTAGLDGIKSIEVRVDAGPRGRFD